MKHKKIYEKIKKQSQRSGVRLSKYLMANGIDSQAFYGHMNGTSSPSYKLLKIYYDKFKIKFEEWDVEDEK